MRGIENTEEGNLIILKVDGQKRLATRSLAPGVKVYGEYTLVQNGFEYRIWDPFHSKLAAALINGLQMIPLKESSRILYLGASTGTTISHVSDIIGDKGLVFGVEFAPRVAREFIDRVAKHRRNVIPVLWDARHPETYPSVFGKVDVVYCDIAQPDQTEIAITNCKIYLQENGILLLIVKAKSIDVTKEPEHIFKEEEQKIISSNFQVLQRVNLEPYDKDHALILAEIV